MMAALRRRVEAAVPPLGSFVEIDGARIHYVDRGSGPAIVLIHGLGGVLGNFTYALVDRLATRMRVIALDRPGAGYSTRPRGMSAALREQARTIVRFIESLGIEKPLVCGHSLGGSIAIALALEAPQIPRALALIAPQTYPLRKAPAPFAGLVIPSPLIRAVVAHTIAIPIAMRTAPRVVGAIFAPEPVPEDFAVKGGALLGLRATQFFSASTDLIAARGGIAGIAAHYGELRLPVHVLYGAQDHVLDCRKHGEMFEREVKAVDLTVVPGGHMLPVTQPDLVANWIFGLS